MLNAIIIEDEKPALENLLDTISQVDQEVKVKASEVRCRVAGCAKEAFQHIWTADVSDKIQTVLRAYVIDNAFIGEERRHRSDTSILLGGDKEQAAVSEAFPPCTLHRPGEINRVGFAAS